MTSPESALDIAREVAPGLGWAPFGGGEALARLGDLQAILYQTRGGSWYAQVRADEYEIAHAYDPAPRACLRAVLDEVHRWALDVARATEVPDGR